MRQTEEKLFRLVKSSSDGEARAGVGLYCPDPDFPDPSDEIIDLSVKDERGFTLLHYAVKRGLEGTVIRLLERGAPVDERDANGCTPLVLATTLLDTKKINEFYVPKIPAIVQALVDRGANVFATDKEKYSCLHLAVGANRLDVFKLFASKIQSRDDLNIVNDNDQTPLQLAVTLGDTYMVKYLINELKADVNFKSQNGRTSLHYAALDDRANIIPILCQADANGESLAKFFPDNAGYTPLRIAQKMKHHATREELEKIERLGSKHSLNF